MKWLRITKESTPVPSHGSKYSDWKPELAEEGFHQCVYCTISESSFGGIRNFHVEHYKPKGLKQFTYLENEFSNLFYACAICNTFKSDDWTDPVDDFSVGCYPDPSKKNYGELFQVDVDTALIAGRNTTGTYLVCKLYLNRPQLIINRKEILAEEMYQILIHIVNDQKNDLFELTEHGHGEALSFLKELDKAVQNLESIFHSRDLSNPYGAEQTKKPASK